MTERIETEPAAAGKGTVGGMSTVSKLLFIAGFLEIVLVFWLALKPA